VTRPTHREAELIERFLKAEAHRQRKEKAHRERFVAAGQENRRKLLRALGVEHKS
jgi:hypothetical protein